MRFTIFCTKGHQAAFSLSRQASPCPSSSSRARTDADWNNEQKEENFFGPIVFSAQIL